MQISLLKFQLKTCYHGAKGLLGDETPKMLLDTVVFYDGLHFALRSGREHRLLRHSPCQVQVVEQPGEQPYLLYHEDASTNHPSSLQGFKSIVKVHSNTQNLERCFFALFKKYRQLCPDDPVDNVFYLQPSLSPTETCWYTRKPLGLASLSSTVARLCKQAGSDSD